MKRAICVLITSVVGFSLVLAATLLLPERTENPPSAELTFPTSDAPSAEPSPTPAPSFPDLSADSSYYEAVSALAQAGVWASDGAPFCPDALATWADLTQAASQLFPLVGRPLPELSDLPQAQAAQEELAQIPLTRGELAQYLYAAFSSDDVQLYMDFSGYLDGEQLTPELEEAMSWALANGCFGALVDTNLYPGLPLTRGQLAQVLERAFALTDEGSRPAAPAFAGLTEAQHQAIQTAVEQAAKDYGAAGGIQAAVIQDGRVVGTYATGWATKGQVAVQTADGAQYLLTDGDLMTPNHKVRVASISKVVIGMVAMKLAEDGIIDLDASIGEYWGCAAKNPHYPDIPVTIRSLLSHTSSIYIAGDDVVRTYQPVFDRLASGAGFTWGVPGSMDCWGYNNYAFGVLGMTLELAAGKTMDQLLDQYFFDSLDIDAAFEPGNVAHSELLTTLYSHSGGVERSLKYQWSDVGKGTPGATGSYFAGGLTISAADLGKLVALLAGDGQFQGLRLMEGSSVEAMETRREPAVGDGFYQCYPLRARDNIYGRPRLYYHTGSAYGVYHCMSYDPDTGDGVVVLTTGASGRKDEFGIYAVCGQIAQAAYDTIG